MKILSLDVGIKNLALCILDINTLKNESKILCWKVINLCDEQKYICCFKTNNAECTTEAKFVKNDIFYCKRHALKTEYKLPTSNLNKYKQLKLPELIKLTEDYDLSFNKPINKNNLIKSIESYINNHVFKNISMIKCKDIKLIDIGIAVKNNLDKLDLLEIDTILIENQIGPLANRMNAIQGMITQYFIMKNMNNILFISGMNKLKLFIGNQKTTYNQRKKLSISITKNILLKNTNFNNWIELINKNKKADDLADCFLQGIWYLTSKQLIKLDLNNI